MLSYPNISLAYRAIARHYDIPGEKPHYIYQYMACLGESWVNHDFTLVFFYAWTLFSQKSPDFRYFPRAIILHILRTFGRQGAVSARDRHFFPYLIVVPDFRFWRPALDFVGNEKCESTFLIRIVLDIFVHASLVVFSLQLNCFFFFAVFKGFIDMNVYRGVPCWSNLIILVFNQT